MAPQKASFLDASESPINVRSVSIISSPGVLQALRPRQVLQSVKAVSALLGGVESLDLREAQHTLRQACVKFDQAKGNEDPAGRLRPEIVEEVCCSLLNLMPI